MPLDCPRCQTENPEVARFCRHCGLCLEVSPDGVLGAGRAPHPEPLAPPEGFLAIGLAANLHYAWHAVGGGRPLLGTEPLVLVVFNGGYDLAQVVLRVSGTGRGEKVLFAVEREIEEWPRGGQTELEISSYELSDTVQTLSVELVQAGFGPRD